MKWRVISASVRGSAHQRTGMPNQDAVDYGISSKGDAPLTVLAVSDGHGSGRHFRSQVGSTFAVHVAVQTVREMMGRPADEPDSTARLAQEVVNAWVAAVHSDLSNNPFTEAELATLEGTDGDRSRILVEERPELAYGATLLIAAVTEQRMILLQLGDGDILAVAADGTTTRPIVADERLVGNQTTSLCQPEAWREFRTAEIKVGDNLPPLVLLSTDGYMNSFRSQEDFLQIGKDYLEILREQGSEALAEELPRILSEATQEGSGDDITLGLLHAEVLPTAVAVLPKEKTTSPPTSTKSVMIQQLTEERSTQQKKLTELESSYAGVRRHVLQLRLLVGLALLAAVVGLTERYWMPLIRGKAPAVSHQPGDGSADQKRPTKGSLKPGKGYPGDDPSTEPIPHTPDAPDGAMPVGKPAAGAPELGGPQDEDAELVLILESGKEVALSAGKTLMADEILGDGKKQAYARVKKRDNILMLTNLSSDAWTLMLPGNNKKGPFKTDDNIPLRPGTKIIFQKSIIGNVTTRNKAS
jgi:hypothetical protein